MKVCPFCQQDIVWHARLKSDLNYNFLMCFECDSVWLADQPVSDQAGTTFEAHMKAGARAPDGRTLKNGSPLSKGPTTMSTITAPRRAICGQGQLLIGKSNEADEEHLRAIEVLKEYNLLDLHTLIVGLEHEWATKADLIEYAEQALRLSREEIDPDLLALAYAESCTPIEVPILARRLPEKREVQTQTELDRASDAWRFAHLTALLHAPETDDEKVQTLQELFSSFGYPADMTSCSIYSNDSIAPLKAAEDLAASLAAKHNFRTEQAPSAGRMSAED